MPLSRVVVGKFVGFASHLAITPPSLGSTSGALPPSDRRTLAHMFVAALSKTDAAFIASLVSMLVSVGALSWTIYSALRVDRACLEVKVSAVIVAPDEPEEAFAVTATNVGKRATQLLSLWLYFGHPYPKWRHRVPPTLRRRLPRASGKMPSSRTRGSGRLSTLRSRGAST